VEVTALDRIAALLHRARLDGGWTDEGVAALVLTELGLSDDGMRLTEKIEVETLRGELALYRAKMIGQAMPPEPGPAPEA
jgi:hypothetical protein